jgi:RNA polymerase sigma factor (sigma-70 family)
MRISKHDRETGFMSDWATTLDSLLRERGGALFGYAYVLTGSATLAEDLLQDALLRTFRSGRGSRDLNSAHAYVKRAITSAFIDSGRRSAARPRTVTDAGVQSAPMPDHAPSSDAAADLQRALLTLPPRERACVVLRYLEDLPVASVAAELGIAVGTAKRYTADGIARLRALDLDVDLAEADTIPVTEGRMR